MNRTVEGPCIPWTGHIGPEGYGRTGSGPCREAHRVAYVQAKGPIPPGYEIDHLCHSLSQTCPGGNSCLHRRCVNPDHLEAVTHAENSRRGASFGRWLRPKCKRGHEWTPENTRLQFNGDRTPVRTCRACQAENTRAYRLRKAA